MKILNTSTTVLFLVFYLAAAPQINAVTLDINDHAQGFPDGSVTLDNGEKIDRGNAAFDVDGDNITEVINVRINKAGKDDLLKVQAFVKSPLDDQLLGKIKGIIGKNGSVKSFTGGSLNHIIVNTTPAGLKALSYQPFIDAIAPADDVHETMNMAREHTGINFAATQAQNLSRPNGLFDNSSPINGDRDGNVNSYSINDVVIAVVDTGIDPNHAAFANGKIIGWKDITGECSSPCDPGINGIGHGTAVASIAAGANQASGQYGVAPGAALVGVKIKNSQGGLIYENIVNGIKWVYDNRSTYNIKVVNLSVSSGASCYPGSNWSAANAAIYDLVNAGVTVVVSMGNGSWGNGATQSCYFNELAARSEPISVGALADPSVDGVDPGPAYPYTKIYGWTVAPWSSMGPTSDGIVRPTISAPGESIIAAKSGTSNGYADFSGTSASTPFVSGIAAALLDGTNFSITPNQVAWYMQSTADFAGGLSYWGNNKYGSGYVRAFEAYKAAIGSSSSWDDGYANSYLNQTCSAPGQTLDFWFYSPSASDTVTATLVASNFMFTLDDSYKQGVWLVSPSGMSKWTVAFYNQGTGLAWSTFNTYDWLPEVGWYHLFAKNNSPYTICDYVTISTHN